MDEWVRTHEISRSRTRDSVASGFAVIVDDTVRLDSCETAGGLWPEKSAYRSSWSMSTLQWRCRLNAMQLTAIISVAWM